MNVWGSGRGLVGSLSSPLLCCPPPRMRMHGRASLSRDVPPGRESATICSASYLADGTIQCEVVDRREGTSRVPTRLAELHEPWKPVAVVVDAGSAACALLPDLQHARTRTHQTGLRDYTQACGAFYDTVMQGKASHVGEPVLDAAVDAARQSTSEKRRSTGPLKRRFGHLAARGRH